MEKCSLNDNTRRNKKYKKWKKNEQGRKRNRARFTVRWRKRERERETEHKQRPIVNAQQENERKCTITNKDAIIQTCRNKIIIETEKVNREGERYRQT